MQPACARMPRREQRDPFLGRDSGRFHAATGHGLWRLAAPDGVPVRPTSRPDAESCRPGALDSYTQYVLYFAHGSVLSWVDQRTVPSQRFFTS